MKDMYCQTAGPLCSCYFLKRGLGGETSSGLQRNTAIWQAKQEQGEVCTHIADRGRLETSENYEQTIGLLYTLCKDSK